MGTHVKALSLHFIVAWKYSCHSQNIKLKMTKQMTHTISREINSSSTIISTSTRYKGDRPCSCDFNKKTLNRDLPLCTEWIASNNDYLRSRAYIEIILWYGLTHGEVLYGAGALRALRTRKWSVCPLGATCTPLMEGLVETLERELPFRTAGHGRLPGDHHWCAGVFVAILSSHWGCDSWTWGYKPLSPHAPAFCRWSHSVRRGRCWWYCGGRCWGSCTSRRDALDDVLLHVGAAEPASDLRILLCS